MASFKLFLLISFTFITAIFTLNPYRVLEVPAYASFKEIKDSYRRLARLYHPDKIKNNGDQVYTREKMQEISEAYRILKEKRNMDDDDDDDNHFSKLILQSIMMIAGIIVFNFIQLNLLKLIVFLVEHGSSLIILFISADHILERYLDHWFESEEYRYLTSLVFTIIIVIAYKLKKMNNRTNDSDLGIQDFSNEEEKSIPNNSSSAEKKSKNSKTEKLSNHQQTNSNKSDKYEKLVQSVINDKPKTN